MYVLVLRIKWSFAKLNLAFAKTQCYYLLYSLLLGLKCFKPKTRLHCLLYEHDDVLFHLRLLS
jgi:hypothetical protein